MSRMKGPALGAVFSVLLAVVALSSSQAPAQAPAPGPAPATWVAVAANESGGYGLGYGRPSREAASSMAMSACGRNCRVDVAIQARCVSFANSTAAGALGYSYGADAKTVEAAALRNCRSAGGGNTCKLQKVLCSP